MKIKERYYKKTEHLLYNYKMFQISIKSMEQEIELLKEEDGFKGISYDGISTSPTNKFQSMTEDTVLSVIEAVDYLEHSIKKSKSKVESVCRALEGLNEIERKIVELNLIEGKRWWDITPIVRYSERHCRRIRGQAIARMAVGIFGSESIEGDEDGNKDKCQRRSDSY